MTTESIASAMPHAEQQQPMQPIIPYVNVDVLPDAPAASPEVAPSPEVSIFTSNQPEIGTKVRFLAEKLRSEVFIDRGFIDEGDLDPLGFYKDPYAQQSVYYYVKNGSKVAAARFIEPVKKKGIMSLPTAKEFGVDAAKLEQAAEVDDIADLKESEVVEISGLASKKIEGEHYSDFDAVMSMYSKMMRDSLEAGHKLWIMNTDKKLIRHFRIMMGEKQVHELGEARDYMGPPTIPAAINPQAVMREIFGNKGEDVDYSFHIKHLKEIFKGIDARKIPQDIQAMFQEHGVDFEPVQGLRKMSKKELAWHSGILAYSAARGLPTLAVEEFDGSTAALVGIDLATAYPYSKGMVEMYKRQSLGKKAAGAAVAIPSFFAPYAYFWAEQGQGYPGYVNGIAATFLGSAVIGEVLGRRSRARRSRKLTQQLAQLPNASH